MKKWHLCVLLAVSVPSMAAAQASFDDIELQSPGGASVLISGADSYSNANFNGWNVSVTGYNDQAAAAFVHPALLNLQVNASCTSGSCLTNPLNVFFTSTIFDVPTTTIPVTPPIPFLTNFTAAQTGGETTSATSWVDFGIPAPFGGALTTNGGSEQLATIIVNTPLGSGSVTNGQVGTCCSGIPYSLTLEESFTDSTGGAASFNAGSNINVDAPEIDSASAASALTLLLGTLMVVRGRRSGVAAA